jgi:hypothetical protein
MEEVLSTPFCQHVHRKQVESGSLLRGNYAFVVEYTLKLLHVLSALHARPSSFLSTFILRIPSVLQACKLLQSGRSEKLAGQFSGCVLCVLFATTKKSTFHLRASYFLVHFCTQTTRSCHARRDVRLALPNNRQEYCVQPVIQQICAIGTSKQHSI